MPWMTKMGGSSFDYLGADGTVCGLDFASIPNCFTGSERNVLRWAQTKRMKSKS